MIKTGGIAPTTFQMSSCSGSSISKGLVAYQFSPALVVVLSLELELVKELIQ